MRAVLAAFPPLLDDLSHRRAEAINETSEMRASVLWSFSAQKVIGLVRLPQLTVESHSAGRHQSRRRLIKQAKARIDEEQENQRVSVRPLLPAWMSNMRHAQIATDASALIRHYKALLLS